jgi:hypothetical protein
MKQILILFLFCFSFLTKGGEIVKTFTFNSLQFSNDGRFERISFPGTHQYGTIGGPAIPFAAVSLILQPGEKAAGIRFEWEDEILIDREVILNPQQPPYPVSEAKKHEQAFNPELYNSKETLPIKKSGTLTTQYFRGVPVALTTFSPVRYIPATKKLSYFRTVRVIIETETSESSPVLSLSASDKKILQKSAQNPEVTDLYPLILNDSNDYSVLIITPDLFINSFTALTDLYFIQGLKSKITALNTIITQVSGIDAPERIRNYILQEYQNNNITHVLLAGDAELMPVRGLYCMVQSSSVYTDNGIPADIYYAALDGNWNTDGDNLWGEPGEEDLLPELSVGRLPVSTMTDFNNLVNKILTYQTHPVIQDLRKPLLVGEKLWDNPVTWGGDFMDLLIGLRSDNGYTTQGIPPAHDEETLYDRDLPAAWTVTTLLSKINEGHSFLHHVGHANTGYLMRMYTSSVTDAAFLQTNGITHGYMPVYTHGCYCASFDIGDCIAEKMLTIQRFCNVFVGNSRYGWFNEGQTEGPSEHLHREFVDALYSDKENRIGMAHTISKIATAPWVTAPGQWEEGALRWCVYTCNVLGDPVMPVWTDQPLSLQKSFPDTISVHDTSLLVNVYDGTNPMPDIRIVFIQGTNLISTTTTDINGQASLQIPVSTIDTGYAWLIFSGYNCLPDTQMVLIRGLSSLSGHLIYDNVYETPIPNTLIHLLKDGLAIGSDTTDASGFYEFQVADTGLYTMEISCPLNWGGVNSSDALLALKHFVNMIDLQGIALQAADVDATNYVNAIDALSIQKRFVGLLLNFAAGDWVFDHSTIHITHSGNYSVLIKGLCTGDVNGSFIPNE